MYYVVIPPKQPEKPKKTGGIKAAFSKLKNAVGEALGNAFVSR